ncbi:MAG: sigma-70 family RNA polymerase sigma factor [Gemmatimonadota bacterium]|nr:sigma-70 family RNA polymerase sigma factor [Gemmatimonadota bacterium]
MALARVVDWRDVDFEAAFHSHQESLFRYVNRLVGDPDLASDVVQESFVRLLDNPLPDNEVRRWLFTVATNLVRDNARMKTRRQRLLTERYERSDLASDPAEIPDEAALKSERIAAARAALEQLTDRDRKMLLMREEGFRYSEIAEVIDVAPGSVGTLLARALRRFADAVDPAHIDEEE